MTAFFLYFWAVLSRLLDGTRVFTEEAEVALLETD